MEEAASHQFSGEEHEVADVSGDSPREKDRPNEGKLLRLWRELQRFPFGGWIFSRLVGRAAPFTGILRARVEQLEPGLARISLRERRKLRQHLGSLHAGALFTLAETASGLAMTAALSDAARCIVTGMSIEYIKKGRGRLTAEARCDVPDPRRREEHRVAIEVRNENGEVVAKASAVWLVGKK